ncbi:hypothetical protein KGP40_09295 [Weissella cibaria]|uniref:hypothetical protein n=1 Tax=Weissella cibaria TaxID=137591 RepID=UPI001C1FD9AE|nr:hypothetical protein [Weissella cibaria]MBU7562099.1 hypothetical protein [Weissella cibaria]
MVYFDKVDTFGAVYPDGTDICSKIRRITWKDERMFEIVVRFFEANWQLLIAMTGLGLSVYNFFDGRQKRSVEKRENKPNIRLIQNLWTDSPYFELRNEANTKLDAIPQPSYFMFIPSKLMTRFSNGEVVSNTVLVPVEYSYVTEQIISGSTTGSLVKSTLSSRFKAKYGEKDVLRSPVKQLDEGMMAWVETYPFLVIVSEVPVASAGKITHKTILSLPQANIDMPADTSGWVLAYLTDNLKYLQIPLDLNSKESIYKTAFEKVTGVMRKIDSGKHPEFATVLGGADHAYGLVLRRIGALISTNEKDPVISFHDLQTNSSGKSFKRGWRYRLNKWVSERISFEYTLMFISKAGQPVLDLLSQVIKERLEKLSKTDAQIQDSALKNKIDEEKK